MRKRLICFMAVCVLAGTAFAAGGDASESGVSTSPLKIYSGGLGGGFLYALSDKFKDECGEVFGKAMWLNSFDFTENVAFFADINWYIGNKIANFGADVGVDYVFSGYRFKPLLGLGVGGHYFHRKGAVGEDYDFGKSFGPSLTAHIGSVIELTESVHFKVRAPLQLIYVGGNADLGLGFNVGVMFVNKLRNVRQLNY